MRISVFRLCFTICILVISSCTVSRSHNAVVALPEDTSMETAQQIIMAVLHDNFMGKIKTEFPYLTEVQLEWLSIYWRVQQMIGDEKSTLSIVIRMQYGGDLTQEDAKAITEYGKTIVEKTVEHYFKMQPGESIQQSLLEVNEVSFEK